MPLQSDKLRLLRRIPDIRFEEETRGYSKDQVDRVLANLAPLADEIERLQARLQEAEQRSASAEARLVEARSPSNNTGAPGMPPAPQPDFDETLRNTLVSAQRQADTTIRESKEEAERLRTEAEFQSNALLADARDQSAEMTTEAVAYRERLMAEAAAERAKMLDEARDEAQGRVDAVEKELAEAHEAERTQLVNQIDELQHTHKLLQDDVTRFEHHLAARSAEVRAALEDITGVLDDPDRLRGSEGIEAAEIEEFQAADYPPIAVEVVALNELDAEAQAAAESTAHPGEVINASELEELAGEDDEIDLELEEEFEQVVIEEDQGFGETTEQPMAGYTEDPQIGVETQSVPSPAPAEAVAVATPPQPNDAEDPFLDELRRVTTEEPQHGDAIADFLDDKQERGGGSWFGRRK